MNQENTMIQNHLNTSKFYSITFEGWNNFSIDANDKEFIKIKNLISKTADFIIELYKNENTLTESIVSISFDGVFILKIATMEKEKKDNL